MCLQILVHLDLIIIMLTLLMVGLVKPTWEAVTKRSGSNMETSQLAVTWVVIVHFVTFLIGTQGDGVVGDNGKIMML